LCAPLARIENPPAAAFGRGCGPPKADRDVRVRRSQTPHSVGARAVGEVEVEQYDVHRLLSEPVDTLFEGHRSLQHDVIEGS
jgi:hypothetical protein